MAVCTKSARGFQLLVLDQANISVSFPSALSIVKVMGRSVDAKKGTNKTVIRRSLSLSPGGQVIRPGHKTSLPTRLA